MLSFFYSIKRVIRDGGKGFKRNFSLSIASIITISLSIFVFLSLVVFNSLIQTTITHLKQKIDLSVYFKPDTPEEKILSFKDGLLQQSEIKDVIYTSPDEALKQFKEKHKNEPVLLQSLEEIDSNPLEANLSVKTKSGAPEEYQKIVETIKKSSMFKDVDSIDYQQNKQIVEKVYQLSRFARRAGIAVSLILFILAIIITFNTIRLTIFNRQEEINVMRLVGAQNWYIRGPFIIEGIILGVISAVAASLIFYPLIWLISPKIAHFIPGSDLKGYVQANFPGLFLIEIILGIILGIFSGMITVGKYLKK